MPTSREKARGYFAEVNPALEVSHIRDGKVVESWFVRPGR
jgi:hypothetical protein